MNDEMIFMFCVTCKNADKINGICRINNQPLTNVIPSTQCREE